MKENIMESMPIRKLVFSMSVPIAASMLIQALYNFVDSAFVANFSPAALLAVSLCYPIQSIMVATACGTAAGFNTVLSRSLGAKQYHKANQIILHGLFLALCNWIVFAILGWCFADWFVGLYSQDPAVIAQGAAYLKICTLFSFGIFIQITYERILQAAGDAMGNMYMQGIGALLNIILDPIFIFGWFGLPALGVVGAAIATVIGQQCAMLTGILIVKKKIKMFDIHPSEFKLSWPLIRQIYKVGVPAILVQSIMSFMTLFMNAVLGMFSALAISAFNVVNKLQQLVYMIVMGVTNGLIPITAFNYGAGKTDRIIEGVRFSIQLAGVVVLVGMAAFELFPVQLFSLFGHDVQLEAIGIPALRISSLSLIFASTSMILCSAFQALNHAQESLVVTLLRQIVLLLPLVWAFASLAGIQACWWAFVIAEVISCFYALYCWKKIKEHLLASSTAMA